MYIPRNLLFCRMKKTGFSSVLARLFQHGVLLRCGLEKDAAKSLLRCIFTQRSGKKLGGKMKNTIKNTKARVKQAPPLVQEVIGLKGGIS